MKTIDVVIVGAGPSGCAAAYDLAKQNLNVLLIDKANFPREKPCAGGLTIKSVNALRYSASPVIRRICRNIHIGHGISKVSSIASDYPLCAMTIRSEFDEFCLRKTIDSGAEFRKIEKLVAVREHDGFVEIETDQGKIASEFLIGADGANSMVRKLTKQFSGIKKGIAIEGKAYPDLSKYPDITFDFGATPDGYGWLFPKGDHVNVGLYSNTPGHNLSREKVLQYAKSKLGVDKVDHLVGHYIGLGGWNYELESERIFLVGDAAGFCDPLLGEGIYYAIKSGQLAAAAIIDEKAGKGRASAHYRQKMIPLKKDVRSGYDTARWFYKYPRLGVSLLSFPLTKYLLMKGFAAGMSYREIKFRPLRVLRAKIAEVEKLSR